MINLEAQAKPVYPHSSTATAMNDYIGSEMAQRMATSRTSLNRLLDPSNPSVTLYTLKRAAAALGRRLRIELV